MESTPTPSPSRKQSKDDPNIYLIYSGMAFEMLATIGILAAIGYYIDKKLNIVFPIATILLSLFGLGIAFYRIYKQQTNS